MRSDQKTYTFNVNGMHCKACVFLTEDELRAHPKVSFVKTSLKTRTVEVRGDFTNASAEEVMKELSSLLSKHTLSIIPQVNSNKWRELIIAFPIAFGFILLFFLLQKGGIIQLVNAEQMSFGTAFFIGVIASLSTCMAVVGGLILSISATSAKDGGKVGPQILFHIGRIISFLVLGGLIGAVGASFQLGAWGSGILGIVIGLVMFILGLNLLDIFTWTKQLQPSMPISISKRGISMVKKMNHKVIPIMIGVLSFFLPCGFTQSMQIYALGTGSFVQGALTMFAFALGTFPVLACVSFSSFSLKDGFHSGVFFKSAGLIVIVFSVFNILNSLVAVGLIQPVFNI
ncbi:sulfite exporter TauE/SafE family protein [Candidatus Uhrbacteria bacterium]|nr:sulfite exporter TauE/SafE family protein [Candidatus Uhrbacteria bacterium]